MYPENGRGLLSWKRALYNGHLMISTALHRIQRLTRRRDVPTEVLLWLHEWQKKGLTTLGDYLEFGSFSGRSATAFYNALRTFYKGALPSDRFHMYLFDSFK